jgi:hypothetical protein
MKTQQQQDETNTQQQQDEMKTQQQQHEMKTHLRLRQTSSSIALFDHERNARMHNCRSML